MRDWTTSGRVKVDRAHKHIKDLEKAISDFRELGPYFAIPEVNPDGRHGVAWKVRVVEEMDPMISAIAADAIHNLHVALDQMWQRAVYGPKPIMQGGFPFYPDPECAKSRFGGKEKGRCKKAVDVLRRADAFRVGNPFWQINCFDNADKHDTMRIAACWLTGFRMNVARIFAAQFVPLSYDAVHYYITADPFTVLEEGTELSFIPGEVLELYPDRQIDFEIAFGKGEVLAGKEIVPAIQGLAESVTSLERDLWNVGLLT